ncbi:MAG: alpha-galactosidase, partial [Armatimonadetes bacterium]|nr:alpha-galactosidase [Armatimonadota bacterium]
VATASDPVNLYQLRRRIKVEKAYRGPTFCVGDCYQVPMDEWRGSSVPESFESALGTGAQVTTFFADLSPEQEKKWKHWIELYRKLGLAWAEYLNLYDIAFDKPETHVVRKGDKLYYGIFAPIWSSRRRIELRGLEKGKQYRVREYAAGIDLGVVSGDKPFIYRGFKDQLLLEVSPVN